MLENLEILNPSKELTMWSVGFETSSEKEKQLVRWQLYKLKILSGLLSFWILYVQYGLILGTVLWESWTHNTHGPVYYTYIVK